MADDENLEVKLLDLSPPALTQDKSGQSDEISTYLASLLESYGCTNGKHLYAPSLTEWSRFFRVSHLKVHDALQHLRNLGFDYRLGSIDAPIEFWHTPTADEETRSRFGSSKKLSQRPLLP